MASLDVKSSCERCSGEASSLDDNYDALPASTPWVSALGYVTTTDMRRYEQMIKGAPLGLSMVMMQHTYPVYNKL